MAVTAEELFEGQAPARPALRVVYGTATGSPRRRSMRIRWDRFAVLLVMTALVLSVVASGDVGGHASALADRRATVVVQPGDTLWDVSLPYAPAGVAPHAWVADVAEVNDVDPGTVAPGTLLRMP